MFCGIDVAKNKSQVCILDDNHNIIKEFIIEHTKEGFDELERNITPETTIAMETTGNYSKAIYDYFKADTKSSTSIMDRCSRLPSYTSLI